MLAFSYGTSQVDSQPDFQRVSDGRHTSGPMESVLLVYDIATKSGCHLTKLISSASAFAPPDGVRGAGLLLLLPGWMSLRSAPSFAPPGGVRAGAGLWLLLPG